MSVGIASLSPEHLKSEMLVIRKIARAATGKASVPLLTNVPGTGAESTSKCSCSHFAPFLRESLEHGTHGFDLTYQSCQKPHSAHNTL